MAQYNSHLSFSFAIAVGYLGLGFIIIATDPGNLLLAGMILVICGMLPDLDAASVPMPGAPHGTGLAAKDLIGLLALIPTIILLERFPALLKGGISQIILVVLLSYIISRTILQRAFQKWTKRRGIFHSFPMSIIVGQLVFLLHWDLSVVDRLFLAGAAFVGYGGHLMLDMFSQFDNMGKPLGGNKKENRPFKFRCASSQATSSAYLVIFVLTFFIASHHIPEVAELRQTIGKKINILKQLV